MNPNTRAQAAMLILHALITTPHRRPTRELEALIPLAVSLADALLDEL